MQKFRTWLLNYLPLIVILLIALGLCLPQLDSSFWLDEAAQALESSRPLSQQHLIADDFQPPFLHYLLHFALYFNQSEAWLRWWGALLPALLAIVFAYQYAQKLFNRRVAILTALLLATSSFQIFYSQELRPYMWSVAWAMISSFFLIKLLFAEKFKKQVLLIFILSTILGLYTSYLYPFVFASHLLILIWQRRFAWFGVVLAGAILGFLPWLTFFLNQLQVGTNLNTLMPGWQEVVSFGPLRSVVMTVAKFVFGVLDLEITPFYIVVTACFILLSLGLVILNLKNIITKNSKSLLTLLILMVAPFLLAWLVSLVVPVIQPKRVIFLLPWFYMLIAIFVARALAAAKLSGRKLLGGGLLLTILFINGWGFYQYQTNPKLQRENWRGLYEDIYAQEDIADTVLIASYKEPFSPWRWYDLQNRAQPLIPTLTTNSYYLPTSVDWKQQLGSVPHYGTVLVFDYLRDLTDPNRELEAWLETLGYNEIGAYDYANIGLVRIFKRS